MQKKDPGQTREREMTLSLTLPDPKIDQFTFVNASLRLHTMRKYLSSFSIVTDLDQSGFDYQVFLRHMIGIKSVALEGTRLDFVKTTSAIFLVAESEKVVALLKGAVPSIDVGKCYLLEDKACRLCLVRFSGDEFEAIEKSAKDSVDVQELKSALARSVPANGLPFDPKAFAEGIKHASSYRDEQDRQIFILDHGDGSTYTMYRGLNPAEREENPLVYSGRSEDSNCYVFRVEVVG
jgi:hypothetical protein